MARYRVHVETGRDGTCVAHVAELMGCFAIGPSLEEALDNLRQEIPRFLDWLEERGERPERPRGAIELEVVERVRSAARFPCEGDDSAVDFFACDAGELSTEDLQTAMRRMELAHRDLLEFLQDAPPDLMEWQPSPQEPSISALLRHVAYAEAHYLAQLEEEPSPQPLLKAVRAWVYYRLSRLSETDRRRVVEHDGQRWSARKALRRFLEHEWEHGAQIRALVERYGRNTRR